MVDEKISHRGFSFLGRWDSAASNRLFAAPPPVRPSAPKHLAAGNPRRPLLRHRSAPPPPPGLLSAMGDYTIRISTSLIEQLARDDEKQVKRKTRKSKPKKVVEQQEEPRDNGMELPAEPKSSPAPGWSLPPPMYLPVTPAPPPPPPVIQEVEAIRAAVVESEKVLEKLQKKEATMREELTKRAKELHDKEFKLPYQNPSPCTDERAGCAECYRSNVQDPLKCAEAVKRFEACVRMARLSGTMGAAQ